MALKGQQALNLPLWDLSLGLARDSTRGRSDVKAALPGLHLASLNFFLH